MEIRQRIAAALVAAVLLLDVHPAPVLLAAACDGPTTPISQIQGSGDASTMDGQPVTIGGVVTADFRGSTGLGGFFMQDPAGDGDPQTSDALFVFVSSSSSSSGPALPADFGPNQRVVLSGTVREFNTITEISNLSDLVVCGPDTVAPTPLGMGDVEGGNLEPFEGMLVTVPETLTVTDTFKQGRFGAVSLSFDGRRYVPVNIFPPDSPEALALSQENPKRLLLMDNASPAQNPHPIPYLGQDNTLRIGDTVQGLTGILAYERESTLPNTTRGFRLEPTVAPSFVRANPRTDAPDPVGGTLKVGSFNVLNYFNGNGQGGGFPTPRGAKTDSDFARQRAKIISAISTIDADIVGLMEMERDGDDELSAIQDLVNGLNDALGPGTYDFVREPAPGDDAIKAAMLYKPGRVTPVGAAMNHQRVGPDTGPLFERPPLAQTFSANASGALVTVVTNHFKSKNCGDDPIADAGNQDVGQGQGCFNARRVLQAAELLQFVGALQAGPTDRVLVIGDLNSNGQELPITTLTDGGLVNQIARFIPTPHSFVFDGASGYLDHALATPSLSALVTGVTEWHINADEPTYLSYESQFNPPELYSPGPYRSSDHDPVIVGLDL
jgi:predicted extracellular nuclease